MYVYIYISRKLGQKIRRKINHANLIGKRENQKLPKKKKSEGYSAGVWSRQAMKCYDFSVLMSE